MRVLLGITGGIAAYKAPDVVRRLRERGHEVRCILTEAGARLVAADALEAVSCQPVAASLWAGAGRIPHIELPRWCDCLLVAPATADCLARLALGLADDLLTTAYLALEEDRPVILAPAMNVVMWQKAVVQQHAASLRARGHVILEPAEGELACGEAGRGAMPEAAVLADAVDALAD